MLTTPHSFLSLRCSRLFNCSYFSFLSSSRQRFYGIIICSIVFYIIYFTFDNFISEQFKFQTIQQRQKHHQERRKLAEGKINNSAWKWIGKNAIDDSPFIDTLIKKFKCNDNSPDSLCNYHRAVVIAHYAEDVSWISSLPSDIYIALYWRNKPEEKYNLNHNNGKEASPYMDFIIRHYYDLPEYIAFVHGHQESWHNVGMIQDQLANIKWNAAYYIDLNYKNFHCMLTSQQPEQAIHSYHHAFVRYGNELPNGLPVDPIPFCNYCCAQFIVHRSLILARSIEFWKEFQHYDGAEIEHFWSRVFGQPWLRDDVTDNGHDKCSIMNCDSNDVETPFHLNSPQPHNVHTPSIQHILSLIQTVKPEVFNHPISQIDANHHDT